MNRGATDNTSSKAPCRSESFARMLFCYSSSLFVLKCKGISAIWSPILPSFRSLHVLQDCGIDCVLLALWLIALSVLKAKPTSGRCPADRCNGSGWLIVLLRFHAVPVSIVWRDPFFLPYTAKSKAPRLGRIRTFTYCPSLNNYMLLLLDWHWQLRAIKTSQARVPAAILEANINETSHLRVLNPFLRITLLMISFTFASRTSGNYNKYQWWP